MFLIILIADTISLRKHAKDKYTYSILMTVVIMAIFTGEYVTVSSIIATLIVVALYLIIKKIQNSKNKGTIEQYYKELRLGLYLAIFNIFYMILVLGYCKLM